MCKPIRHSSFVIFHSSFVIASLFLSACVPSTRPSLKIGLVAPFVGQYREIGEEVIPAVRLALREANAAGGIHGYSVELMAYDDEGDPALAAEQARKLATDPQVVGVIGNWLDSTTLAAAPLYAAAQIPYLATTKASDLDPQAFRLWITDAQLHTAGENLKITNFCDTACGQTLDDLDWLVNDYHQDSQFRIIGPSLWGLNQFPRLVGDATTSVYVVTPAPLPADSSDPAFTQRYQTVAPGVQPRFLAVLAYDATKLLLAALDTDLAAHATPSRTGLTDALSHTTYTGLSGPLSFNAQHNWQNAQPWVYHWQDGSLVKP